MVSKSVITFVITMTSAEDIKYLKYWFDEQLIISVEQLIKYSFPKIENLNVTKDKDDSLSITFNEGVYTKEEVESKLEEFKRPPLEDIIKNI